MKRSTCLLGLLCAVTAMKSAGSSPGADVARPNLLFIAVDDLRPDLGCYGHEVVNYEACARVGLMISVPGMRKHRKTDARVEPIDIYPSLGELCGLKLPGSLEGTSFVPLLQAPDRPWKTAAFTCLTDYTTRSIRTERYRFIERAAGPNELYDCRQDPAEDHNLAGAPASQGVLRQMQAALGAGWRSARPASAPAQPRVEKRAFGRLPDGTAVDVYRLANGRGLEAEVMTVGATLISVKTPDRQGRIGEVTLCRPSYEEYAKGHPLLGSVVGRYANRIAGARFLLDGAECKLEPNAGKNHIHGGGRKTGFAWLPWRAEPWAEPASAGVRLRLTSPDGQAGFPGTLEVDVVYRLTQRDELVIDYTATTDKPTHVNLTNHAYWNLTGDPAREVLDHQLTLYAEHYLPADQAKVPLGPMRSVRGTPMDFTEPRTLGARMTQTDYKIYDHCYVLRKPPGQRLALAARVEEPTSGRVMEVFTTQPGVQLYTGNALGFCLETQHFPNAPNEPSYPSTVLRPGQTYRETTVHQFRCR